MNMFKMGKRGKTMLSLREVNITNNKIKYNNYSFSLIFALIVIVCGQVSCRFQAREPRVIYSELNMLIKYSSVSHRRTQAVLQTIREHVFDHYICYAITSPI